MATNRDDKLKKLIKEAAAEFIQRESNGLSLITITRAEITSNSKNITIYFTVMPEEKKQAALDFANRNRSEFFEFLKKKIKAGWLPKMVFAYDYGEKNRQRIDEII